MDIPIELFHHGVGNGRGDETRTAMPNPDDVLSARNAPVLKAHLLKRVDGLPEPFQPEGAIHFLVRQYARDLAKSLLKLRFISSESLDHIERVIPEHHEFSRRI